MTRTSDFLIIGGGVVGLAVAASLRARYPKASILVIEKEPRCGMHASGRNSGVLHAGFYYSADSLKARFTRDGNARLRAFCAERGISVNACGKLVVAQNERDLDGLDELLRRAEKNGVVAHEIDAAEARRLEPLARTVERALWSPTTGSVDPLQVISALVDEARRNGTIVETDCAYQGRDGQRVRTSKGWITAGYVVNAAGLHADAVAHDFGFAKELSILPIKGLYLYASSPTGLQRHVYPVPDLAQPFLGVHFTVTPDGHTKIGPTAIPALWREQYGGLAGFRIGEAWEILVRASQLFLRNDFDFRALARTELRKRHRSVMVDLASRLVPSASAMGFERRGAPGIRAQLLNVRTRRLVMDFHIEGDGRSMHILNAVSPAFTCALPFGDHVVDEIAARTAVRSTFTH